MVIVAEAVEAGVGVNVSGTGDGVAPPKLVGGVVRVLLIGTEVVELVVVLPTPKIK